MVRNAADNQTLASLAQPTPFICAAPLTVNDTCNIDPATYRWVFYNDSPDTANVFYTVAKLISQRVVTVNSNSDSLEVLPGDTVLITTDTVAGGSMCVFYDNGLIDTIVNDAGLCAPEISIEAVCSTNPAERIYAISNNSNYSANLSVLAGFFPQSLQLGPNETSNFVTTQTSIVVRNAADNQTLASLAQPSPFLCESPIVATDTCSTDPAAYRWVFYNNSNEVANVFYTVAKLVSQRVVNINSNSDSVAVLPGDTVLITTDTVAGNAMCVFYENGVIDTVVNEAGMCNPEISIEAVCTNTAAERNFLITNNSNFAADLSVLAGFFPQPLQLGANERFNFITTQTSIVIRNASNGETLASLAQPTASICAPPLVVNDTCSVDAASYRWVFYNNSNEPAHVFYTVSKLITQRVVNVNSNADSLEVLPGDTVLITTDTVAGNAMCIFYESGLVDTLVNDAGFCDPEISIEAACTSNPAQRNFLIKNNSNFPADLSVLAGFFAQPLQLGANESYNLITTQTSIVVRNAGSGATLATLAQPNHFSCEPPVIATDTCTIDPAFHRWAFYNNTDETANLYYTVTKLITQRVVTINSNSDSVELLPGDTVIVTTDTIAGDAMCVFYVNGLIDTVFNEKELCDIPPLDIDNVNLAPVCHNDAALNRWRFENGNAFEVDVTLDFSGEVITLPAAGNGVTADGNPGGNFTFVFAPDSINPISVSYGNNQNLTVNHTVGVCDDTPDPESCEEDELTYTLSNAVSDAYHNGNDNHSIWFSGFNGEGTVTMTFDPDAYLVLSDDGSRAYITGNATMDNGSLAGSRWVVYAPFGAKAANTGFKKELKSEAYDPNDGGIDTDLWKMFLMEESAFIRQIDGNGYINLTRRPSNGNLGLQVGVGANGKNTNLGASSWFSYNYNGQGYKNGDFNLDLKAFCPPISIGVDALCSDDDATNRWAIENATNRSLTVQYSINSGTKTSLSIPKAGMGSDADGNANAGNYTFFTTDASAGDSLTVYYSFTESIAVAANTSACPIPDGTIDAINVCSPNKNKNRWRVSNSNAFPVTITLAHSGQEIVLPAAGLGADVNGNPNAGNYTFINTSKLVTDFTFTFGTEQSITTPFFTGPCDMNPDPESCDGDKFTFNLSNAISDAYHGGNDNHSIWLSGFNDERTVRLTFDSTAYLVYRDNGSKAYIHGEATMTQGSLAGSRWVVYVPFQRKASNTVPKKELKANAYDPNDGDVDTELWKLFLMRENAFMRQLDGDGYINMTRKPADGKYGLQIGKGANGKNINLGASFWFDYSYNGQSYRQGDFNLDLAPTCPDVDIDVEALCKEHPRKNRWRITNSTDRHFRIQYTVDGSQKYTKFIPRAGKGRDADGNANSGDYTFITTNANQGNILTVYYALDQEVTAEADTTFCPVPEGSITVENVCANKKNKNRWRVSNSNDFPVFVQLAHNNRFVRLPAAGKGRDADGNANSGNYTFFHTHKSITEFTITFGATQSASALFITGPCSVNPDPESCDNGNWTHDLSNAVSDAYHSGNSNHSIALFGLGRLTFEDGAYLVYNSNGERAYITGRATFHSGNLTGSTWEVYAPFEAKNDLTRPKKELRANAYDPNDGGVDVDTWALFLMGEGAFMKEVDGDGYIRMSTMPADGKYGLQIGKGANGKNIEFGASAWFFYSLNGGDWKQGDFNLNLSPQCDDVSACSIYYIDNAKDKIYFTKPKQNQGKVRVKEYVPSPYSDAHIALNIDGTKLFVFESRGPIHDYGYFDTQTHVFKPVGQLNIPGGIVQAAFNPQGQLYFSSTSSDEIFVMDDPMSPGTEVSYGTITIQETGQTMNIAGADIAFDQDGSFYIGTHAHGAAIFTVSGLQGHLVAKQFGHACRGKITGMAVMPDARTLIYSVKNATGMYVVDMDNPDNFQFLQFQGPVQQSGWGDMTSACLDYVEPCDGYAVSVVNFNQGTQQDGDAVPSNRSNANNALGAPQESNNLNFVSLGFRGYIELELASPVYNHNKNGVAVGHSNSIEDAYGDGISYADFIVVETSYGRMNTNCGPDQTGNYPELALVYGKEKPEDPWVLLTPSTVCRTSFIDIGPAVESGQLEYVKYVKILDCTDYARFGGNADGYDVDGLIICPDEVVGAITGEGRGALVNAKSNDTGFDLDLNFFNRAPNDAPEDFEAAEVKFNVFPNPSSGKITVASNLGYMKEATLTIHNTLGVEIYRGKVSGETNVSVDLSRFGTGVYIVQMANDTDTRTSRVVIR
ncbi:MAG: T9SS type A sorting domain-containing protein [Flammeovirgaceae bacterium]